MTLDPDPLTVTDIRGDPQLEELYRAELSFDERLGRAFDDGYEAGYREASERRRLAVVPFLWGSAFGAAVALIIALAVLR